MHIKPGIRNYDWGEKGRSALLPQLLHLKPKKNVPFAELWIGTDKLPVLAKIISAEKCLSIQAHPNARQAKSGFSAGIYHDPHPKNEVIIALSEFHLLSGFRPVSEIRRLWAGAPELSGALKPPGSGGLKDFCRRLLSLDQSAANRILGSLVKRLKKQGKFTRRNPEYWLLKGDRERSLGNFRDKGLFFFYLLNLVRLRTGEAHFIAPGKIHAHLQGRGIEVMNNSDNVVRAGLTAKKVNVPELLKIGDFSPGKPKILAVNRTGGINLSFSNFRIKMSRENILTAAPGFEARYEADSASILLHICYKKLRTVLEVSC